MGPPLPAGAGPARHDRPPAAAADRAPRAEISLLPPISQPGREVAPSRRAETVVAARFAPVRKGRPVVLTRRERGAWQPVARAVLDGRGLAEFSAPTLRRGRKVTYRVTALPYRGLSRHSTARVVSTAWSRPGFVDEFTGSALGSAWEHRVQIHNPWGGRACSKGSPSAVAVADGALRLSVLADPERADLCAAEDADGSPLGSFPYRLNANVSTQRTADFRYGVAAARMKFQRAPGQHAAFWLQPRGLLETGPTPWGAEIDVIEWYGEGTRMASVVHRPGPDGTSVQIGGGIADSDDFLAGRSDRWWRAYHVFSVEWTPTAYVFRIDGRETWRTSEGVSDHPEFLILSMLSSDYELPRLGDAALPQHAYVDWVQFWEAG
jgi:hypothetical protein